MSLPPEPAAAITSERLIAIVRATSGNQAVQHVESLLAASVQIVEISLTTPDALKAIAQARKRHPRALIGAGTVRSIEDAERAADAGAQFLVSPALDRGVVRWAAEQDVLHLPGVLSPTELDAAIFAGAAMIKLFPAGRMGPDYVRDLLAPFPYARLVPTGGITRSNAQAFLDAGAVAVAIGSGLVHATTGVDSASVAAAARQYRLPIPARASAGPTRPEDS